MAFAGGKDRGRRGVSKPGPKNDVYTARDAALRALEDVASRGAYASQAIDRALTFKPLSDEDRRLATGIFYTAVENRMKNEYILSKFVRTAPDPVVSNILQIALAQLLYLDRVPDHAAVDEAVKQAFRLSGRQITGFVNGVLRSVIRARDDGTLPVVGKDDPGLYLTNEYSVSGDLAATLINEFGIDEAEKICACRERSSAQTVRCNLLTSSDSELEAFLRDKGIEFEKGSVEHAYNCQRAGGLTSYEAYRKGMFSIQGESAMLAAYATEAKIGMNVLDCCAAPGGKAALMCEMMNGTGRVYAWDVHEHRVDLIKAAAKRLRLYNLRQSVRDATQSYEPFNSFMDVVLIDAPCTGLGVMSDKPDIRLKFASSRVDELTSIQTRLLDNCSRFVKPGGLLVYSTCTILHAENEERVTRFLNENPNFAPETSTDYLPERFRPLSKDGMLRLMPHRDGVEGFFIARMRRMF